MKYSQAFSRLLVLFGMAWFILWACAPMMSAPPSPRIPSEYNKELGYGLNAGAGNDYEDIFEEPVHCGSEIPPSEVQDCLDQRYSQIWEPVASVQLWQRFQVGARRQNEVGLLMQAGYPTLLSGGVYYRVNVFNDGPVQVGHQIEAGGLWVGYSLPVAIPLGERVWLTTQPSIRASAFSIVQVPVGMSLQLGKRSRLDAEVGLHAGGQSGPYMPGYPFMMYGGLALAHHFGKPTQPFRTSTKAKKKSKLVSAFLRARKNPMGEQPESVGNATVSSQSGFYLKCDAVDFAKYKQRARVQIEREQRCTFTQGGRSHEFRLRPGSHFACNLSDRKTISCVEMAK
jgi:hypothetical protein